MIDFIRASADDAALIAAIGRTTFLSAHAQSASAEDLAVYAAEHLSVEVFRSELADPDSIFHLIHVDGVPAGYSKIVPNLAHPLIPAARVTKLERLYLFNRFRGTGVGRESFDFNRDLSEQLGEAGMWLIVWRGNHRAIEFYRKRGFQIIGETLFKISETRSNPNYWMYVQY